MSTKFPALLALITCAAVITLSACSSAPQNQLSPNPAHNDSMRTECPGVIRSYSELSDPDTLSALKLRAEQTFASHGLRVLWVLQSEHGQGLAFTEERSDRQRLTRLLDAILPAFSRYPSHYFQNMQVRDIVLVKDFHVGGQFRLAMPAPESDSLVYADNGHPQLCMAGMEMRTHHEFYHLIEHRLHRDFYFRDPAWLALNPVNTNYGQGGATAYGKQFQNLGHPRAGMISLYAEYGVEEDKAEVFGWMMTPGYAERLQAWAKQDNSLAAKLDWMHKLLVAPSHQIKIPSPANAG